MTEQCVVCGKVVPERRQICPSCVENTIHSNTCEKKKIYIVTDGCYSNYHIEAVFTDLKQAELYCATHTGDIEEFDADTHHFDTTKEPKISWTGVFYKSGEQEWHEICRQYTFNNFERIIRSWGKVYVTITLDKSVSKEKAEKILCDKYAQWENGQIEKGLITL